MNKFACLIAGLSLGALVACTTADRTAAPTVTFAPAAQTFPTSFTCGGGNSPVQYAVCANARLAELDLRMAAAFQKHMRGDDLFQRDQVIASQRAWLIGLQKACNAPPQPGAKGPSSTLTNCLASAYQARTAALTNWPVRRPTARAKAMKEYVEYKLRDNKGGAVCSALLSAAPAIMSPDGSLDTTRLSGATQIAGSHGRGSGAGGIAVDTYETGAYGGFQIRAKSVTVGGASVIDKTTLGSYVVTMPNKGGRFSTYASQTGDYGAIDAFTYGGQTYALVTEPIGYYTPAGSGEAAVAGVFALGGATATPACLFQTYLKPAYQGTLGRQPSLTQLIALIDTIRGAPRPELAGSDRQNAAQIGGETRWIVLNMPLVALADAKERGWTGWLRQRHDGALDSLSTWSEQNPQNRAQFNRMFDLLRPAANELGQAFRQEQGLKTEEASQAVGIAIMELIYQASIDIAPGLGAGPKDPGAYRGYGPRYPILATPNS